MPDVQVGCRAMTYSSSSVDDMPDCLEMCSDSANDHTTQLESSGINVWSAAIQAGCIDALVYLAKGDVKLVTDRDGVTVLMDSARCQRLDVVKFIVSHLKDLYKTTAFLADQDLSGRNCLFYALNSENIDILEFLFLEGASMLRCNNGTTLLMTAVMLDNRLAVKYLLENWRQPGCDPNDVDSLGRNSFFYCIMGKADVETFETPL